MHLRQVLWGDGRVCDTRLGIWIGHIRLLLFLLESVCRLPDWRQCELMSGSPYVMFMMSPADALLPVLGSLKSPCAGTGIVLTFTHRIGLHTVQSSFYWATVCAGNGAMVAVVLLCESHFVDTVCHYCDPVGRRQPCGMPQASSCQQVLHPQLAAHDSSLIRQALSPGLIYEKLRITIDGAT